MLTLGMRLSQRSVRALQKVLTGDDIGKGKGPVAPYRSCPELMEFFNEFGFDDTYSWGGGAPTRWVYAEDRLRDLNGKPELKAVIEASLDPLHFKDTEFTSEGAVEHLRDYLSRDGIRLVRRHDGRFSATDDQASKAVTPTLSEAIETGTMEFVEEQTRKCELKLASGDHDGAITNARSMVEAVLLRIQRKYDDAAPPYKGDLLKLHRRVATILNMDPARPDIPDALRQVLSGMTAVVNGIAAARNSMADAHARTYKPSAHHARLVINAALALADFILASEQYQKERGTL